MMKMTMMIGTTLRSGNNCKAQKEGLVDRFGFAFRVAFEISDSDTWRRHQWSSPLIYLVLEHCEIRELVQCCTASQGMY